MVAIATLGFASGDQEEAPDIYAPEYKEATVKVTTVKNSYKNDKSTGVVETANTGVVLQNRLSICWPYAYVGPEDLQNGRLFAPIQSLEYVSIHGRKWSVVSVEMPCYPTIEVVLGGPYK